MTHTSIVMTATNRPAHLRNALQSWCNINYPSFDFTLVDNASECPEIEQIANEFKDRLNLVFYKEPTMTSVNILWNKYAKASIGEYIIFAMQDEILVGNDVIQQMQEFPENRASIFTYFMDEVQTQAINGMNWKDDPTVIPKPSTDQTTAGLISHITGAYRKYWDWFGWFRGDDKGHLWLDQDLHIREVALHNWCRTPKEAYCLHQWHKVKIQEDFMRPGYHYVNEMQARLLEPAERDSS